MDIFGKVLSWKEMQEQEKDLLIKMMVQFERAIKIEESPYDIPKLARAIQYSRSGMGGSALTEFECAFCGEIEIWSNTAVPNICRSCSEEMATNIVLYKSDLLKEEEKKGDFK